MDKPWSLANQKFVEQSTCDLLLSMSSYLVCEDVFILYFAEVSQYSYFSCHLGVSVDSMSLFTLSPQVSTEGLMLNHCGVPLKAGFLLKCYILQHPMFHPLTFHYVGTGLTNLQAGRMPNTQMAWGKEPKKTCESTVGIDGRVPRHGGPNTCPS